MAPLLLYRAVLRHKVADTLNALEAFRGHVFNMRSIKLTRRMLPAVRIATLRDNRVNASQAHDIGNMDGELILRLDVTVEDRSDPATADQLDFLCCLAETALLSDPSIRRDIRYVASIDTTIELNAEGELRTANAALEYAIRYTDCFALVIPDELKTIRWRLDFIDPIADPNTGSPPAGVPGGYPGGFPGPDGRIEAAFEVALAQDDSTHGAPAPTEAARTASAEADR